jgi:hypothetical protein
MVGQGPGDDYRHVAKIHAVDAFQRDGKPAIKNVTANELVVLVVVRQAEHRGTRLRLGDPVSNSDFGAIVR